MTVSIWTVLGAIGRLLLGFGILLLLFAAYMLWGTGLIEASHQAALRQEFDRALAAHPANLHTGATSTTSSTLPSGLSQQLAAGAAPGEGRPVAILQIPKLGFQKVVVEGTAEDDLALGPGHYRSTPLPGQPGNAAIAGHRTTYGAPFYNLDQLTAGDHIDVTTLQGRFTYVVRRTEIVAPSDVAVLDPTTTPELTLTTCNPRFSASQRLVVHASLLSTPAPAPPPPSATKPVPVHSDASGLAGSHAGWGGAALWGTGALAVGVAAWGVARRLPRSRRWLAYGAGVPPLLVLLFFFFSSVAPRLPASF